MIGGCLRNTLVSHRADLAFAELIEHIVGTNAIPRTGQPDVETSVGFTIDEVAAAVLRIFLSYVPSRLFSYIHHSDSNFRSIACDKVIPCAPRACLCDKYALMFRNSLKFSSRA